MNGIDVDVLLEGLLALVGDVEAIGEDGILAGAAFSGKNGRIAFSAFTPNGEKSLADDASYTDPAYEVRGKEEIASHIGRSLSGEAYGGPELGPGSR
jgi:hypothetical protein